jgi:hypothetical protein
MPRETPPRLDYLQPPLAKPLLAPRALQQAPVEAEAVLELARTRRAQSGLPLRATEAEAASSASTPF